MEWRLKEVLTLDPLGSELVDGAEVYSRLEDLPLDESIPFGIVFTPEASEPGSAGVPSIKGPDPVVRGVPPAC